MTDFADSAMAVLSEDECWQQLAASEVGRLAICLGEGEAPEIFPVNFVVENRAVLFRTAEGTKLAAVAAFPQVAFEVDGFDAGRGEAWSVVARGSARVLELLSDVHAAQALPLVPWHAAPKPIFVRIDPATISGRRFHAVHRPHEA
jgi:nitroimidazol reductase NimA-like FMN-containing flavoprotein (pyridoxamine 5'-phosphate oxidase superfamily)